MIVLLLACADPASGQDPTKTATVSTSDDSAPTTTDSADLDTADPDTADPNTVALAGACALDQRWGGFEVVSYPEYGLVSGTVLDGVVPLTVLDVLTSSGECTLYRRNNPSCIPACTAGDTCDHSGICVPYPLGVSLGELSMTGLVEPVVMSPVEPGMQYFYTRIANPPYTPGGLVTLRSTAAVDPALLAAPLQLHGVGVDPVSGASDSWVLSDNTPLILRWDPPTSHSRASVRLVLSIDQHGASPASLTCDFVDDGEGTVPAELLDQLRGLGVTGFPSGTLARRTVDHTEVGAGCMDLVVSHEIPTSVVVDGHIPCDEPSDCPEGTTCDLSVETCG